MPSVNLPKASSAAKQRRQLVEISNCARERKQTNAMRDYVNKKDFTSNRNMFGEEVTWSMQYVDADLIVFGKPRLITITNEIRSSCDVIRFSKDMVPL